MAGKEDAVQEAASPASFQESRNDYGYFLKPDDVNTFWERRYGHKCPYMDPLPVMAYLRKKGLERGKRTNEQVKTIRTLSGRAVRPKTAGATLGSRLHSVNPGGQARAKTTEQQRPSTVHHGSREVMVGQLMPPPHGTASSSILGGRRRQRTLREADVATSSPGFKAPSRPESSAKTAEGEGLVTRRLQDALLYSEILLPTLYGHERPPSQTDTGKAKHISRREVEDAHVEAVVSMHSRAHALRVASAAAACTEDKTLKTEPPPPPKAAQTTPKPPSRASSLPASRKIVTKPSIKTPLTASSPQLAPAKAAPTKSGHSGPIKHVSRAVKGKDAVPVKGKPEATPKQKEGLASSSHEGSGSATTATPGYDDEEFEVTSTHSDQGGAQAVQDEEKQALAPLGQGGHENGSKGPLGEHRPAKVAEEEHYASDHNEHEPHAQQMPATATKAQSEAHRVSASDEEYTFDSDKSSPSLHASEGSKQEEEQPAPDTQEDTFEMETEGSQQTKSQVSLQSSMAPPEPQEVKAAQSQAGEKEDERNKEDDGFEADAQSSQQTESQASLQPSLVQAQTPTQQAEPAVAEGVDKEEESYKEDDGFEADTAVSEANKSQASLPSALQVQVPVQQAAAVNTDKEEEESYNEEDESFEADAEGSQPTKSQASLQSSKAEAPAPAQQVQEAAPASVNKEEESYKDDDGFEVDAEGSQQSKSQASLPTKSQTSLQSSGAAHPSQEKDEQEEEEDYAFETETEDGQQTTSQTSLQTKSQTSLQPSVAVQPIQPVVVEEQEEENYAFESEAEDGQHTPSHASLPKSVAKQPSSDPPSRQSSMAADLDMDISASTAAEAEKHNAFVRGEGLPPDGAGRLSEAPVIRRSVTDFEVPPTPKTGRPSPFTGDLLKAIQDKPTLKKTAPPSETLTQKDDTEERLELTRRSQAALDELRIHLQTQQLLLAGELALVTGQPVGRGRRAKVYQATWTKPEAGSTVSQMVAVKEFEFDSAKHTLPPMPVIHAFRQELESLRRVKHENVVALLGAQLQPNLRIITELLPEGSLFDCIKRKDFWATLTLTDKLTILRDVARGLSAVHAASMAHRDVKSHNVLIDAREAGQATADGRFHAKVADLGSAVVLQEGTQVTDEAGTSGWIAPEVLEGGGYDARADVFSLGVVVWEALSASLSNPLTSLDATRLRERLADPATHLPLPTDVSRDLRQLIAACLAVEPSQRPSMADVHKQLDAMLESDGSSQAAAEESYSDDEDYSED